MKRPVDNLLDKFHSVEISQSCRMDNTHISPDICFPSLNTAHEKKGIEQIEDICLLERFQT